MNYVSASTYCRVAQGVSWFVEEHGVLIIDELSRDSVRLSYPEAAVWDLLVRGSSTLRTASLLREGFALTESEARILVENCVRQWRDIAWLNVYVEG